MGSHAVADFEILSERENSSGWCFEAQLICDEGGGLRRVTLLLAWADYNLWSVDGADRPTAVAEAALSYLISEVGADAIPDRFDASIIRRRFPDADREIPKLIRR